MYSSVWIAGFCLCGTAAALRATMTPAAVALLEEASDALRKDAMAENEQPAEPDRERSRTWDYSSDPLKDGGMQIMAVVVGFLLCLAVGGLVVAWLLLSLRAAGPAP